MSRIWEHVKSNVLLYYCVAVITASLIIGCKEFL